jgi:hypothetical protein
MRFVVGCAIAGVTGVACWTAVSRSPVLVAAAPGCGMSGYRAQPGLTATSESGGVALTWDGDRAERVRLRLGLREGAPIVRELAVSASRGDWAVLARDVVPEVRVVSGLRRMTNQQLDPLAGIGVPITHEILERYKWEAFWDAPLNIPGGRAEHNDTTPPQRGVLDQPGLPRSPSEVKRAVAAFHATECEVRSDGARIDVSFPGVALGVFNGRIEFTVFKGTNLIRQEVVATTSEPSVAYKFDAGLTGIQVGTQTRAVWRDHLDRSLHEYRFGDTSHPEPVPVRTANRVLAVEQAGGSLTAFPAPHTFFWARETSANLGYNWYRQDTSTTLSFGIRQAEAEDPGAEGDQNFALYSARPNTSQRMAMYVYPTSLKGETALDAALAFTRGDRFKAVPGYQVMATHFHMGMLRKLMAAGGLDAKIPDLEVLKAAGVTIAAPIDGGGATLGAAASPAAIPGIDDPKWFHWTRGLGAPPELNIYGDTLGTTFQASRDAADAAARLGRGDDVESGAGRGGRGGRGSGRAGGPGRGAAGSRDPFAAQMQYYDAATHQSSASFVVMPNAEIMRGDVARNLGGHSDILFSHRVFWTQGREPGQPLSEPDAKHGTIYHIGNTADMMEMTHRENLLVYMPHPRSKGSTGFPDAIKNEPHFLDSNYRGVGIRWGMGLDGSETRLCEYRCLALFDDMNNWVADKPTPPKYVHAISELYSQKVGDDVYANNPVNYVRLDRLPAPGDWTPIVDAMKRGDYFWTSGEVLIPSYRIEGTGARRTIVATVEWTFPLDFVEVVWGDGTKTDRQIVDAHDTQAFGRKEFRIPFTTTGRKWVRFAAWDSAGNGALVMPVKLPEAVQPPPDRRP